MVKNKYIKNNFIRLTYEQKKILLITVFCVAGVLSDLLAVKVCRWSYFSIEAGCLLFPITYLIGDVLVDEFGYNTMINTAKLGMLSKILMVLVGTAAILLPYDPVTFGVNQGHLSYVFGFVPRIVIASLCGYFVGQWVNAKLMVMIKEWTNGKYLFLRTIGSTIGGEFVDTILFIGIAFIGSMPPLYLIGFIFTQYVLKVGIETVLQPVTYKAIDWVKED